MKSLWGHGNRYLRVRRNNIEISPKAARLLLFLIFFLIVVIFVAGDVGLWNLWTAQKQLKNLEEQIKEYEAENTLLKVEIEMLKSDPFAIEKVAREKYGYLRPGDRIYRIITLSNGQERGAITPSTLDSPNKP